MYSIFNKNEHVKRSLKLPFTECVAIQRETAFLTNYSSSLDFVTSFICLVSN